MENRRKFHPLCCDQQPKQNWSGWWEFERCTVCTKHFVIDDHIAEYIATWKWSKVDVHDKAMQPLFCSGYSRADTSPNRSHQCLKRWSMNAWKRRIHLCLCRHAFRWAVESAVTMATDWKWNFVLFSVSIFKELCYSQFVTRQEQEWRVKLKRGPSPRTAALEMGRAKNRTTIDSRPISIYKTRTFFCWFFCRVNWYYADCWLVNWFRNFGYADSVSTDLVDFA